MAVATVRRILHRSMRRLHLCIAGYLANLSRLTSNCCQHQMIKWLKHWMKVTCPRPILSYSDERLCWLLIKADWGSSSASFCKVGSGLLLGLPSSSAFSCNAHAPPEACWQQAKARMGNEVPTQLSLLNSWSLILVPSVRARAPGVRTKPSVMS